MHFLHPEDTQSWTAAGNIVNKLALYEALPENYPNDTFVNWEQYVTVSGLVDPLSSRKVARRLLHIGGPALDGIESKEPDCSTNLECNLRNGGYNYMPNVNLALDDRNYLTRGSDLCVADALTTLMEQNTKAFQREKMDYLQYPDSHLAKTLANRVDSRAEALLDEANGSEALTAKAVLLDEYAHRMAAAQNKELKLDRKAREAAEAEEAE